MLQSSSVNQELIWLEPQKPEEIIEELIEKHQKTKFYCLFSGGKDSCSITNFIAKNYPKYFKGAIFTNTGIATQATRNWVLGYCKAKGWPLNMTWARKSYYDIVMETGFPTMGGHRIIMGYLKFQSWYYFLRDFEMLDTASLISGVRKKESMMRNKVKFYSKTPIDINANMTFCKPFLYKNADQLYEYFIGNGLSASPVYEWDDKSGECRCGSQANPWELKLLEKNDPLTFNTIKWLEKKIQEKIPEIRKKIQELEIITTKTLHYKKKKNQTELEKLHKQLDLLMERPVWGKSVGAEATELQNTLEGFVPNEDYCGESCEVMAN